MHAVVLLACLLLKRIQPTKPTEEVTYIEVEPKPNKKQESRIVQTSPAERVEKSDSKFLSWQNQQADRETVSRNKEIKMGSESRAMKSSKSSPKPTLSHLGIPLLPPASQPHPNESNWATPGTRPEDFIPGMAESDRTALNTQEYRFYSYFQRIREQLDRAWVPILRQKLVAYYQSGRQLASDMDHTTKILVILNAEGEIVRVQMVSESGIRDLDEAAVSAFKKAGPFPNPPRGMIDANKEVRVPWDFILKT